jgi:hypothetical protein
MAKKKTTGAAAKSAALTAEEFQKLSAEEQVAYLEKVQAENAELKSSLKAVSTELPSVDVEGTAEVEAGTYQFTCPTFTWDDGRIVDVRELVAEAESAEEKVSQKAQVIIAQLLQRNSGILARKGGNDE